MNFSDFMFFLLGIAVATVFWVRAIRRLIDQLIEKKIQERLDETQCIEMRIELVDNMVLCYNVENKEFVCQGADILEVMDNFKKRYPEYNGMLTADDKDSAAQEWIRNNRSRMQELGIQ